MDLPGGCSRRFRPRVRTYTYTSAWFTNVIKLLRADRCSVGGEREKERGEKYRIGVVDRRLTRSCWAHSTYVQLRWSTSDCTIND